MNRPVLVLAAWIVGAIALIALAPSMGSSRDQEDFLPSHYESVRADRIQQNSFPQHESAAAILVFQRSDGGALTSGDKAAVARVTKALDGKHYNTFKNVVTAPGAVSRNGRVALASAYSTEKDLGADPVLDSVKKLRKDAGPLLGGTGLKLGVTGTAAQNVDANQATGDTDAMIMMATLLLIVVLLGIIFRSPLIAILPVVLIFLVFMMAQGLIATASHLFGLKADSGNGAILIVVLFGVGTDYILFLLFRYREHLRSGQAPKEALTQGVSRVGETIASAAGAVIVAFLALLLSTMSSMRALGPSLAICVALALAAALTLVPAAFSLLGTKAFWPSKAWQRSPKNRLGRKLGAATSRRPKLVAAISGAALVVLALCSLGFRANYDAGSSLPGNLESVRAMKDMEKAFAAGESDPSQVYVKAEGAGALDPSALAEFRRDMAAVHGVDQVSQAVLNPAGNVARYDVVLSYRPASSQAIDLVSGTLRDTVHTKAPKGTEAVLGGTTAVFADIKNAVNRDYQVVFPAAGVAIALILGLLLRGAVAPLYLIVSVGLGFGATLGSTVLVFQQLRDSSGLLFMLPIIVYLFVVAIGTDYNILLVARLREEIRRGRTPAEATRLAVSQSAPTISAAAVILAGTFGVLMLADNSMLQQMGFAVAFGILLTAFVMALLLVPTITTLLGARAWWPSGKAGARPRLPVADTDEDPDPTAEPVRV
ncbi:MMPL family transporter [Streptomyces sp. FXJ1.172]|uniref:MMPL family transporter n=1 Tax=Streptomyces sp. FXJ1.172 TaxID=710705 RepID=UPI001F182313|nr:MMPL family transporter [Streptomyces sp. FXJ1.172]WEO94713.1 MMPL family transporter [Streptomyces sp. FXJ1.172]